MNPPLLTIGMAHYQDFAGLWATIQGIRMNHVGLTPQFEFVVINNSPEDRKTAGAIMGLLGVPNGNYDYSQGVDGSMGLCAGSRYVEMPNIKGTSASREAIFAHAKGQYVVVMDCHLVLSPATLPILLQYYRDHPRTLDILSGALINDTMQSFSTHFRDDWGGGMWGQWSQAWQCQCGPKGSYFDLQKVKLESGTEMAMPRRLLLGNVPISECEACHKPIPDYGWNQHERNYMAKGFGIAGVNPGPAFEIPGQGLGMFSCRKEAWLGFNLHARAFGGEELYIHEKFRKAGRRALCIPGALWNHRFYREGGAKYPNTNFDKVRNLVLEFNEIGLPVAPIKKHFVDDPIVEHLAEKPPRTLYYLTQSAWDALMEDPINNTEDPGPRKLAAEQAAKLLPHLTTIEALFAEVAPIKRDLNEHMPVFRALSQRCEGDVVELTARRESTIAFLAGRPKSLTSFTTEVDAHVQKAGSLVADTTKFTPRQYTMGHIIADLPASDLLFIDTKHTFYQLQKELEVYAPRCRRFIALHDTEVYGERGDDGQLGLRFAIAEFCDLHPQWAVIDHTKEQYGLTILSCVIDDRPETPVEGFNVPHGPGTELKKILSSLGIAPSATCSCNSKAAQMDIWGIDGCEVPANFETIVGWLREGTWSGLDLAGAVARSFFSGIAWEINPLHPFESLVKLCVKRAREVEAKRAKEVAL